MSKGNGAAHRPDFAAIAGWIRMESSVLDLGCGDGALLRYLTNTRRVTGYGIEIDDASVLACVQNGVQVVQSDLERGLSGFDDNSFDYVVLSQTLQAMKNSEIIIREMLRVGREGIVTFPNFGYWKNRLEVLRGRHAPLRAASLAELDDLLREVERRGDYKKGLRAERHRRGRRDDGERRGGRRRN